MSGPFRQFIQMFLSRETNNTKGIASEAGCRSNFLSSECPVVRQRNLFERNERKQNGRTTLPRFSCPPRASRLREKESNRERARSLGTAKKIAVASEWAREE